MAGSNESYLGHTDLVDEIILFNQEKGIQYRFTISEFRGKNYIGIREWYQDFEGDFAPTNNGVTLPYDLQITSRLFSALANVLSKAEVLAEVQNAISSDTQKE